MYKELIRKILTGERQKGKINLILVSDKEIQRLNRDFRHRDKPTDVLAWPLNEAGILGDIAISEETTKKNAKRFGVSYRAELKRLVIHGVLHLLGYDHGRKMRRAEETYQKF